MRNFAVGFVAIFAMAGTAFSEAKESPKKLAADLGGGVKMELVLIPSGEFLMGSPDSDKDAFPREKPQHEVRTTKPFYLGKYLVTQEQWEAVTGDNPSHFKGPKNPVEQVSWDGPARICRSAHRISDLPGYGHHNLGFRVCLVPAEAAEPKADTTHSAQIPATGVATTQIYFAGPEGLVVQRDSTPSGRSDSERLVAPARDNFPQGASHRLKLTNIPGRPGVEFLATIEVSKPVARSEAFLAHNAVPVDFSDDDLDYLMTGKPVTKAIFLPDPEFHVLPGGIGTLVSTKLDPGVDPIVEAGRRGAIVAVVRLEARVVPATVAPVSAQGLGLPTVSPLAAQELVFRGRLEGSVRSGCALAFSPDGKTLACGGDNAVIAKTLAFEGDNAVIVGYKTETGDSVNLWDMPTGKKFASSNECSVSALAFTLDGKMLAVANYAEVGLLDVRTCARSQASKALFGER